MNSEEMRDLLRMEYSKGRYDAITKAIEWLYQRQAVDLEVSDIEKFIEDLENAFPELKESEDYFNACHRQSIIARQQIKTNRL